MADWESILKSLAVVEADCPKYGSAVMCRLFAKYPFIQKMWPKMATLSKADLPHDAHTTNIGALVVQKWAELIKAKGNHMTLLKPVSQLHAATHGIPINYMKCLAETIWEVVAEVAGLSASGKDSLKKMIDVIMTDMNTTYKELGYAVLCC